MAGLLSNYDDSQLTVTDLIGLLGKPLAPKSTIDSPDYNLLGYIQKYGNPDTSNGQHLTDEFKLPNHITFSDQSIYSRPEMQGGSWKQGGNDKWLFNPSDFNLKQHSAKDLINYFKKYERKGTIVQLPDGSIAEGSQ